MTYSTTTVQSSNLIKKASFPRSSRELSREGSYNYYFRSAIGGLLPISLPKKHPTETALLYVANALKAAINRQDTALVLIDFSAVLDTIHHKIVIQRLRLHYGIVDKALGWLQSYLQGRTRIIEHTMFLLLPVKDWAPLRAF